MTDQVYARMLIRIKTNEGLRLHPYLDTAGVLSIGYGRNLTDGGISQQEAADLLTHDLEEAESDLGRAWPWVTSLDDVRLGVLIEMAFNMGMPRFSGFVKFTAAMQAHDYGRAAQEMLNSDWAHQVGQRAQRLSAIMLSGKDGS